MAIGRLVGDRWVDYVGRVKAIQLGGSCAALGMLIALISNLPVLAIVGFTLAGIGVSVIFPCLLTLAGQDKPQGRLLINAISIPSAAQLPPN